MGAPVSHIGGYGIPAIPTQPATAMFSHRIHGFTQMVRLRSGLPQNTQNSQKFIVEKELPQISRIYTDGWLRSGLPQNTQNSQKFIAEKKLPQISRIYTDGWLRSGLPQNTQNSQKFIAEKKLPQISRIYTDVSKMFCVFREFCGSKYLCKSVGEYSLPVCSVNSVNSVGVNIYVKQ